MGAFRSAERRFIKMQKFKKLFKRKTLAHRLIACALVLSMALPSFPASATSEPSFDNGYSTSDEDIKDESADGEVTRDTQNSQSIENSQNTQDSDNLSVVVKEPVYAPSDNINYDLKNFIKRATLAGENITVAGNNWKVINSGVN